MIRKDPFLSLGVVNSSAINMSSDTLQCRLNWRCLILQSQPTYIYKLIISRQKVYTMLLSWLGNFAVSNSTYISIMVDTILVVLFCLQTGENMMSMAQGAMDSVKNTLGIGDRKS